MRPIDADSLPVSKVGNIKIVLLDDIKKAKTVKVVEKYIASKKTIDTNWLLKQLADAVAKDACLDEHIDGKNFLLMTRIIAEWEREHADN